MKRRKFSKCFVAMLLVIVMGITAVPMSVLTVVADGVKSVTEELKVENTYTPPNEIESTDLIDSSELENAYILDEKIEGRTFNSKEFIMSDGTILVQQFAQNIHYEDEEGLKEIDNTIVEVENENGETTYENSANFYKVKMSKNFKPNKEFLELKNGEYHLSFTFVDNSAKNATANKNDKVKGKSNNKYNDKKVKNPKSYSSGEGKIYYTDIAKGVDLEYETQDNGIKENIIVNDYIADYDFDFNIKVKNLTLIKNADGSISAINEEGEEKYVIPAPFMFDANGEYNYEVEYVLTEAEDGYTLTISADKDWIETEAKLPVTIDPIIEILYDNGYEFRNVYQSGTVSTSGSEVYVGEKDSGNKSNAYVRFELPEKGETYTLLGATITYSHKTEGMSLLKNKSIKYSVNLVDSKQDLSSINVDKVPKRIETLGVKGASVNLASTEETNTLKINANNIKNEEALAFSFETEEQNSSGGYVSIYTTGERALYLTTQYIQNVGIDESYSMETAEIEGATAYVNKATGGLTVDIDLLSISNPGMPLNAKLTYNSFYDEVYEEYDFPSYVGHNFKLNYQQCVTNITPTSLTLIDGDGSVVPFTYTDGVYRSKDRLLTAVENASEVLIYDAALNVRKFVNGRLVQIYNLQALNTAAINYERIEINYTQIYDQGDLKILNVCYYRAGATEPTYKIAFTYISNLGLITEASSYYGTKFLEAVIFEYDENNYLMKLKRSRARTYVATMEYDPYENYLENIYDKNSDGLCFNYLPHEEKIYQIHHTSKSNEVDTLKWYDYMEFDYNSAPSVTEVNYVSNNMYTSKSYACFDSMLNPISEWSVNERGEVLGGNRGIYTAVSSSSIADYTRTSTSFTQKENDTVYPATFRLSTGQSSYITVNRRDEVENSSYYKYGVTFLVESQYDIDLTVIAGNVATKRIILPSGGKLYVTMECGYFNSKTFMFTNNSSVNATTISKINYDYIGYSKETVRYENYSTLVDVYALREAISYTRQGEYKRNTYDEKQRLTMEEYATRLDPVLETSTYTYTGALTGSLVDYWQGRVSRVETVRNNEVISTIESNYVGETTETVLTKLNDSTGGAIKKRTTETTQMNSSGYSIIKTDANNMQTTQTFDRLNGDIRLKSVEQSGIIEEYTYDYFGNITKIKVKDSTGVVFSVSESQFSSGNPYQHTFGGQTYAYTYDSYGNVNSIKQGTDTMLSYEYDGDNFNGYLDDLTRKTYANGQLEEYDYSYGVYSVTHKKQNGDALEITDVYDYTYDTRNRVTSSSYEKNGAVQLTYNYGDLNNKTQSVLTTTGLSYGAEFTINNHSLYNRITSTVDKFTNNGVDTIYTNSYGYNNKNYLTSNTIGDYNSSIGYDAFDRLNTYVAKNNNTIVVDRTYYYAGYTVNGVVYSTDRLDYIYDSKDPYNTIENSYNSNGLISQIKYNGKTYNYTYDDLGRLKTETVDGTTITYKYDLNAYLEADQFIETLAFNSLSEVVGGEYGASYTYDNKGRLSSLVQQGETLYFTYDAMGNPTTYKGSASNAPANMTWTQGRKLASGTLNGNAFAYQYDMNGMRYKKTVNGNVTEYYLDGSTIIAENRIIDNTNNLIYYIYDSMGLSGMVYNGQNYYYVKNTLGDIIGIRNSSGTTVATYTYDAWGNILSMSGSMADINPFRYRGYYYDTESGFYYLQTRYYDPTIRQFINADNYELLPTLSQTIGQLNLYAYANNNPIMYTDETGESFIVVILGAVIGGLISAGFEIANQVNANGWEISSWNLMEIGVSFLAGALSGAIAASPIGVGWQMLANAGINMLQNVALGNSGENFNFVEMLFSGVVGAVAGVLGGAGAGWAANPMAAYIGDYSLKALFRVSVSGILRASLFNFAATHYYNWVGGGR